MTEEDIQNFWGRKLPLFDHDWKKTIPFNIHFSGDWTGISIRFCFYFSFISFLREILELCFYQCLVFSVPYRREQSHE